MPIPPPLPTPTTRRRRALPFVALLLVAFVATSCLPAEPSSGRAGPVRKVEVIGDSLTWGLFGTTPSVEIPLRQKLAASGISLTMDGGPGATIDTPWPGQPRWVDQLRARIQSDDPDVIIIQSVLLPNSTNADTVASYKRAVTELYDVAQSRGAHVYIVAHHRPNNSTEYNAAVFAEQLQGELAAGRGISTIPLAWWMDRCRGGLTAGGWHLTETGEQCWANAANAAVNQLRNAIG